MKKLAFILSIVICLAVVITSCSTKPKCSESKGAARPTVLCSIQMIADLVQEVAQDTVNVQTLIKKELDPHSYELVKGDDEKFLQAHLILYNGLGLEHNPSIHQHLTTHTNSHALGDYVQAYHPDRILMIDHTPDPHIWMDVSLWEKTVPCLIEQLSALCPEHKNFYEANGEKLCHQMQKTHADMLALLNTLPQQKRYLITCHDAFNYFAKTYLANTQEAQSGQWQSRFIAPEGLAPDCQLSTSDIQKVVDFIRKNQVKTIFPEYNVNLDSIHKIHEASLKSGLQVNISKAPLYGDSFSQNNAQEKYLDMIWHNAQTIYQKLSEDL